MLHPPPLLECLLEPHRSFPAPLLCSLPFRPPTTRSCPSPFIPSGARPRSRTSGTLAMRKSRAGQGKAQTRSLGGVRVMITGDAEAVSAPSEVRVRFQPAFTGAPLLDQFSTSPNIPLCAPENAFANKIAINKGELLIFTGVESPDIGSRSIKVRSCRRFHPWRVGDVHESEQALPVQRDSATTSRQMLVTVRIQSDWKQTSKAKKNNVRMWY